MPKTIILSQALTVRAGIILLVFLQPLLSGCGNTPGGGGIDLSRHPTVWDVAISPDGNTVAASYGALAGEYDVRLWSLHQSAGSYANPTVLDGYGTYVVALAYSPDGQMLATGSEDGKVLLWDLD